MTNEIAGSPNYALDLFYGQTMRQGVTQAPDSNGAAGANEYVEFLNGSFNVYNKTKDHTPLYQGSDYDFWSAAKINAWQLIDPRVIYLAEPNGLGQWLAVQLSQDTGVYFACTRSTYSPSPFPTPGAWEGGYFPLVGADFPQIGFDGTGIYLTLQVGVSGTRWSQIVYLPRDAALAFPPKLDGRIISAPLDRKDYGTGLYPIADLSGSSREFATFISVNSNTSQDLTYVKVKPSPPNLQFSNYVNIPIKSFYSPLSRPVRQPDPNARNVIWDNAGIVAAPQSDGSNVWVTHTISTLAYELRVRWYRLTIDSAGDLKLANWGELGAAGYDYYNPSIASFGKDDYTVVCFSRSGNSPTDGNIGTYAAIIREDGSNPPQTTIVPIQAGLANNFNPGGATRWGDYSTIWRDVSNENSRNMWMINQFVYTSSQWREVIASLQVDPLA